MKAKIIIALFLLLIGMGDLAEHHMVCAAAVVRSIPCTDEEIGKKADKERLPISYTDEEIGKKEKPERHE
jgi:hypothetical protein